MDWPSLTVRLSTLPHYVGLDAVRELKVRRRGEVKSNTYNPAVPAPLPFLSFEEVSSRPLIFTVLLNYLAGHPFS